LYAIRADGEEFPIEASISQVDMQGEKLFTVILRDVSVRLRLEAELRQAQKIEAIGQLAGGVAHEFNNFLGVILGYSEILAEESGENETLRKSATEIKAATQHAASLTKQLLAFGRRQVSEPQVVDLNQSIWEAHKLLRRLVPVSIEIVPMLGPSIGRVRIDPGQVQQILINLVANARDAMPEGGRVGIETSEIEIGEHSHGPAGLLPGRYVLLSVTDTGTGMDAGTRSHLFEPFYTTKGPGKGTGLGLSTVYGIVKHAGGHISVDTTEGKGATFHLYLPRVQQTEYPNSPVDATPAAPPLRGRILVVEDEASLRHLLSASLEKHGLHVLAAKDGVEAIEMFDQCGDQIRLVVTDLMMPRMNGFELRKQVAAKFPEVKFLFMSGYAEHFLDPQKQSLAGCDFLEKPFLPRQLLDKVRGLLGTEAAA
jgi:two-component system, cell cycle sensor histidine kinase and response regulator CckA